MNGYQFYAPRCSLFGYGCLKDLKGELVRRNFKKALVVTDASLVKLGIAGQVTDVLKDAQMEFAVFDGVKPNPTVGNVDQGLAMLKAEGCDMIVSIGGGSAHDCAKAVSILASNGGRIQDYRGVDKSRISPLPLVAVNTTAGTASETTRAYVIVDEEKQEKYGSKDQNVIPAVAVDDHRLMMELPKGLTAGTGMDALTHAVEAYTSANGFLLTSELAVSAIRLIFRHLEKAVLDPDKESREGMAVGQYLAGLSFGNAGCGLVHSMSHQLSALYDLPHGLCNAILLPRVCRFNASDPTAMRKYGELAESIFPLEAHGKAREEKAELFFDKLEELSGRIGTRVPLSSLKVKKEDIPLLAEKALLDGSLGNNPVQPKKEEIEEMFHDLMENGRG